MTQPHCVRNERRRFPSVFFPVDVVFVTSSSKDCFDEYALFQMQNDGLESLTISTITG